jgi:hypothetical protein
MATSNMLLATDFTPEDIINARNDFIQKFLDKGATYLRQIDRDRVPRDSLKFWTKRITGNEILIEYHLFKSPNDLPMLTQWRLVDN